MRFLRTDDMLRMQTARRRLCGLRRPCPGGRAAEGGVSPSGRQHRPPPFEQRVSRSQPRRQRLRRPPARSSPGPSSTRGCQLDPPTAQALYTGILTDTGQFRFTSTSRRMLRPGAASSSRRGASPAGAGFELYERETPGKLRLAPALPRLPAAGMRRARRASARCAEGSSPKPAPGPRTRRGLSTTPGSIDGVDIGVLIEEQARRSGEGEPARQGRRRCRVDLVAAQVRRRGSCLRGRAEP